MLSTRYSCNRVTFGVKRTSFSREWIGGTRGFRCVCSASPTQKLPDIVRLALADDKLLIVGKREQPALAAQGAHLAHVIDIHQSPAVNSAKVGVAQLELNGFERLRRQIAFFRRDDPDQVPLRFKGQHLVGVEQKILISALCDDPPDGTPCRRLRDFRRRRLPGRFRRSWTKLQSPINRLYERLLADRFQKVIDRARFERLNRVLVPRR